MGNLLNDKIKRLSERADDIQKTFRDKGHFMDNNMFVFLFKELNYINDTLNCLYNKVS